MKRTSIFILIFMFTLSCSVSGQEEYFDRIEIFSVGPGIAVISYVSQNISDTIINYGESRNSLVNEFRVDSDTRYHYAEITGLTQGKHYYFQIEDDINRQSEIYEFTTLKNPASSYLFSIGIFTDLHHTYNQLDDNQTGFLYGHSDFFMTQLINDFTINTNSFIICKGDITDAGTQEQFDSFLVFYSSPGFSTDFYPVIGNHDKKDTYWTNAFNVMTSSGATDYSFDFNGWHFIILDSAVPGTDDGHFSESTLIFLDNDLNLNQGKKTLIFLHHLVNPIPGVTDNPYVDLSFTLVDNRQEFKNIIKNYPDVWIVFSGHAHLNSVTFENNVLYVVSGPVIHYPCMFNLIHVYENAVVQESRKICDSVQLSEQSREQMWEYVDSHYGFLIEDLADQVIEIITGELTDRCFNYVQGEYFVYKPESRNSVKVYPNPVKRSNTVNFEIQFEKMEIINKIELKIFDISGMKILEKTISQFKIKNLNPFIIEFSLDLNNNFRRKPASGIYLYKLKVNKYEYSGKIAIVK